jgi:hypothetical protein
MSNVREPWLYAERIKECAKCGHEFAAGEPVWRRRSGLGRGMFGGWRSGVVATCEQCSTSWRGYFAPEPCERCGRPVHNEISSRRRRHTFCCQRCACEAFSTTTSTAARERRAQTRGPSRSCKHCGEVFEPARADALFCSGVCRQRAYRCRVTDAKSVVSDAFDIRNGKRRVTGVKCLSA